MNTMSYNRLNIAILAPLGILILLLLNTPPGEAKTIVVDDEGGGNYTTVQDAIDSADAGDIIFILEGNYRENIVVNKSVILMGEDNESTVLDGDKIGDVVRVTAPHVNISCLKVLNSGASHSGIRLMSNDTNIYDTRITGNNYGIFIGSTAENISIERNCIFENNVGIRAYGTHDILWNNICDNRDYGIDAHDNSGHTISASTNWYGDSSGPYHPENNSEGKGDNITDHVDCYTWENDPVDTDNHAPIIELIEPKANELGELPLYKTRPTLIWQNKDPDKWDQIAGAMKYTLYIGTNQSKLENMSQEVRSAVFVQEPDKSTPVDVLDAPSAAIYYWGIFAEDKYENTTYVSGGAFIFDDEVPSMGDVIPLKGDLRDDPLPIGDVVVFGPGHKNSKGQKIGVPDAFEIHLSDNFGLKFSNNYNTGKRLFIDEYNLPSTVFSFKVLYYYAGQYEDDLPVFYLFVDRNGTNGNIETLTGQKNATIYMIPDGPMPDGQYHFWFIAGDEVRWGSYMDFFFAIDLTAPEIPTDITITPETYRDPVLGDLYLKAGETYTLSVTAPSSLDDASMSRVVFQQAVAGYE
ncbi:MAG: hypothetical protein KAU14_08085, partial [Thermoplasmata archaeon]|nr:hypothetical protein [Thermoplasmata archaeon]